MKKFAALSLLGLLLTGCGQPPTATVSPELTPAKPRVLTQDQSRRLLSATGSTLWGASYTQVHTWGQYEQRFWVEIPGYKWGGYWDAKIVQYDNVTPTMSFSGAGELIKASYDRYVYQVPAGKVLVLNQLEGSGAMYVNGYGFSVSGNARNVQYMFGPGELVTVKFAPAQTTSYGDGKGPTQYQTRHYASVAVTGFTADPSALGSMGGLMGTK